MLYATKAINDKRSTRVRIKECEDAPITVESGATEHAVNNLLHFEKVTKIEDVNLTVANG